MHETPEISLKQRCEALVEELGLGVSGDVRDVSPLTGGVASDIALVTLPDRKLCVKFALPKLKVAADWHAPVHRNAAEYAWLRVASDLLPESAVQLFGRSETNHGFAMEFVEGRDVYLWKATLLSEQPSRGEAAQVAKMIGRIQSASAKDSFDRSAFNNRDDFRALRIEPYLHFTAEKHPDLAANITEVAGLLYESAQVLVHGDVSPKNILFREGGPVLLDAECATMGDASFDLAFCLNHLVLKAVHLPSTRAGLLAQVSEFWAAYRPYVDWETPSDLEARTCRLLPMLMLARVDGKSPVEYLNRHAQGLVRNIAIDLIRHPTTHVGDVLHRLDTFLKDKIRDCNPNSKGTPRVGFPRKPYR